MNERTNERMNDMRVNRQEHLCFELMLAGLKFWRNWLGAKCKGVFTSLAREMPFYDVSAPPHSHLLDNHCVKRSLEGKERQSNWKNLLLWLSLSQADSPFFFICFSSSLLLPPPPLFSQLLPLYSIACCQSLRHPQNPRLASSGTYYCLCFGTCPWLSWLSWTACRSLLSQSGSQPPGSSLPPFLLIPNLPAGFSQKQRKHFSGSLLPLF